jgi:hypothetical protein
MAAEFDRVFPFRGWDKDNKWQMVPLHGDCYLYLHDGAGLTVTCDKPTMVTVTEIRENAVPGFWDRLPSRHGDRIFKLHGESKTNAKIQAKNAGGAVIAQVEVDTKPKLTKKVTFYFIRDSATPPHRTTHPPAEAAQWVRIVNYIFQQCNIVIESPPPTAKTVAGDLGRVVMFTDGTTDAWATLVGLRDPGADHTVFQVWEYEQDGTMDHDDANGGTKAEDKITIIEDHASCIHAHTVAHELGHAFGLDHPTSAATGKNHIMWGADRTGQHMDKTEINTINP